jgi:hypothetical protein
MLVVITFVLAIAAFTQPWYRIQYAPNGGTEVAELQFFWRKTKYTYGGSSNYSFYSSNESLLASTMSVILAFLTFGTVTCLLLIIGQCYLIYRGRKSKVCILLAVTNFIMFLIAFFTSWNINNGL